MRRAALFACLAACAEWRLPPTFPRDAAERPVIHEQALLGLSEAGNAAIAQLIDADGMLPSLELAVVEAAKPGLRVLARAPPDVAGRVAGRLLEMGRAPSPALAALVAAEWPEALARARETGEIGDTLRNLTETSDEFRRVSPIFPISGVPQAGAIPLAVTAEEEDGEIVFRLGDRVAEPSVELARVPVPGTPLQPQLWFRGGAVWMLAGSVQPGVPLRRAVLLRHAVLARAEAELHDRHGREEAAAGNLDAARREFARSVACDDRYVDGLYDAASAAAASGDAEQAVALLRRAAVADPGRVQVLGRNDEHLEMLRQRADVRAILGLRRMPRDDVAPPP